MIDIDIQLSDPNIWTKHNPLQIILKEKSLLQNKLKKIDHFTTSFEDAITLAELARAESCSETFQEASEHLQKLEYDLQKSLLETLLCGELDSNDTYLEINSGAGGTEAQDWGEMLVRMYLRWAEKKGYTYSLLSETLGEEAGIKSATYKISGHNAYGWLKTENGVHRLVRISPFDSSSRRHTSFASVWVYPVVDDTIEINIQEKDCRIDTFRASGAGGQHVNTTDSAVRITHIPTHIVVQCQAERSQFQNREQAWKMLKARLYEREIKARQDKTQQTQASKTDIAWGHQTRSYVLHPYQMVKDLRTQKETSHVQDVLNGHLDPFMEQFLLLKIAPPRQ